MKLKKIEEGMVIHCNTEKEAKELINWAHECGFSWLMNSSIYLTYWNMNKCHGIYYYFGIFLKWSITYDNESKKNTEFIEFSDLVISEKEPKFKVGDIVITKEHGESWIIADIDRNDKFTTFYRCIPRFINSNMTYLFKEDEIELSLEEPAEEELNAEEAIEWLIKGCFDSRFYDIGGEDGDINSVFDKFSAEDIVNKIKQYKKERTPLPLHEIEWVYSVINCYTNKEEIICKTEQGAKTYCEKLAKEIGTKCKYECICRVKES